MSSYLQQVGLTVHGFVLAVTSTTAAKSTSKSSSSATLLLIVGFGLLVYLFVLRPRSQKMRRAQQQTGAAAVGDEVMLTSGIIGRVIEFEGDRATIEIAPEIEIEVVRRAVSQVLTKADADVSLDVSPDPGYDADQHEDDDDDEYADDDDATDAHSGDDADDDADASDDSNELDVSNPGPKVKPEPGPGAALDLGGESRSRS
jgi:preprotein translocase subunit YajC